MPAQHLVISQVVKGIILCKFQKTQCFCKIQLYFVFSDKLNHIHEFILPLTKTDWNSATSTIVVVGFFVLNSKFF